MLRLAAALLVALVPGSPASAKPASPRSTAPSARKADPSVMPLDAVLVVIEGEPVTSAQVLARLRLMQGLAGKVPPSPERPLTMEQAHQELVEARLLSWDAARKDITVTDSEVDRLLEVLAKQLATDGSVKAMTELLNAQGIHFSDYRAWMRQEILFSKLDRLGDPAPTRKERLRRLRAEAQMLSPGELLRLVPAELRTCTKAATDADARSLSAASPGTAQVAAVCIEGEPSPASAARLSQLAARVRPGTALDREAVSRAVLSLLEGEGAAEAAAAYALSMQPGEAPERGKSLRVVFRIREAPRLIAIETPGLPAGIEFSTSLPDGRVSQRGLRRLIDGAQQTLHAAGFRSAEVKTERIPAASGDGSAPSGERVRLQITSGPRTRIAQIDLVGAAASRRATLLALLPVRALDPYREGETTEARSKLEQYYLDHGYLRASIAAPEALTESPASDGSPQVRLRFVIQEGPLCQLVSLRFSGALPLPEAELRRHITSPLGQPPSLAALRADIQRVLDAAQAAGKSVSITPITSLRGDTGLLDVTLQFDASSQPQSGGAAFKRL